MPKRNHDRDGLYRSPNSPYWRGSFTDAQGRRIRRSTGEIDKAKARLILADWIAREGRARERANVIYRSFEELMLGYLDHARTLKGRPRSPKTLARDEGCVKALYDEFATHLMPMEGVREYAGEVLDGAAVMAYVERRRVAGVNDGTIRRELAVLGAAITWANATLHWRITDPTRHRKPPQPEGRLRWITRAEAERLIARAEAEPRSPYLADWITVALHTGCRRDELLTLTWERVDLGRGIIYLESHHTKSRRRESVPLNDTARAALVRRASFRASYCPASPWVFCGKDGQQVRSIRKAFGTACRKAGIVDFRIHDTRHTTASWLVQDGHPLTVVKELLRHSSITVTEKYAHLAPENARSAVRSLDAPAQDSHTSSQQVRVKGGEGA